MIRINLLGKDTTRDTSTGPIILLYGCSMALLLGVFFIFYWSLGSSIGELNREQARLDSELKKLQETTKEVRELETKKKELREKLVVIARLKKNKVGPVRILDDLNIALPERAWILTAAEKSGVLQVDGKALDNQTIATFMNDLDKSDYFDTVELVQSKQSEMDGVKIKEFTLQAKISYTGKIKIVDEPAAETTQPARGKGKGKKA